MTIALPIQMNETVQTALQDGQAVVALESTIITHGMPYPQNAEMAASVEAIIREEGAIPATIAVIDGTLHIGLTPEQTNALAQTTGTMKLSRADLAFAMASGKSGGTTVAATMMAASWAGIDVFATGGIGGVHRGVELTFDISADLQEFTKTPVITVSAGVKAILDIPRTLEMLETLGVPVIGYQSDAFPAFWSRNSGLKSPLRLDTPTDIANFWLMRRHLAIEGGMLIGNPLPTEAEIPNDVINLYIDKALKMASDNGITGKAVTPYLLGTLLELTEGMSLKANIALVENNARLAAGIAKAIAEENAK